MSYHPVPGDPPPPHSPGKVCTPTATRLWVAATRAPWFSASRSTATGVPPSCTSSTRVSSSSASWTAAIWLSRLLVSSASASTLNPTSTPTPCEGR